jgi:Rrf2 family protein
MAANSRFAVATHIMTGLSLQPSNDWVSSRYLASSVNTNPVVVRRILRDLQKANLIQTHAGKNGGARLRKKPEKITLLDIYSAINEGPTFAYNPSDTNKKCALSCSMKQLLEPIFTLADTAVANELKKITLSTIKSKANI